MSEQEKDLKETEPKKKGKKEKVKKSVGREILEWVLTILCAVAAALLIRSLLFELVRVDGESMLDTLNNKEVMFVSKTDYSTTWLSLPWQSNNAKERAPRIVQFGNPKRLDVVICRYPLRGDTNFVKRVVGMPGETVALDSEGYLLIDGKEVPEERAIAGITDDYRRNTIACEACYVPKKGDELTIEADAGSREGFILKLNGEEWTRRHTCLVAKTADNRTVKIYSQNTDESSKATRAADIRAETVISCDGKIMKPADFLSAYPDLKLTVDEDYYFVMGDHRSNSNDSRASGPLQRSAIIGHARQVVFFFGLRGIE